jgi:hypothetical protein
MIRPKNLPHDSNERAHQIGQLLTGEEEPSSAMKRKNPHAVALGRRGGLKGGRARADKLSAEERRQSAKTAAKARWQKKI